jgi:chaperonin GroES
MSVNLKPLGNHLVIEPIEEQEITAFGIILPETAKEKPQKGVVLAAGPGRRLESGERQNLEVTEGDTVVYAKYGGTTIKLGTRELVILTEDDVLAIVG